MATLVLWAIPLFSAAIGWLTNYLAIKMLFHPQKPVKLFFFTLQGVLPRRRELVASSLAEIIRDHFVSNLDLKEMLESSLAGDLEDELLVIIEKRIDSFIDTELSKLFPMLSMFITDEMKYKIKKVILGEIYDALPEIKDKIAERVLSNINIEALVLEKARSLSFQAIETILKRVIKKELRFIELMGAVLGFIIGLIQLGVLQLGLLPVV